MAGKQNKAQRSKDNGSNRKKPTGRCRNAKRRIRHQVLRNIIKTYRTKGNKQRGEQEKPGAVPTENPNQTTVRQTRDSTGEDQEVQSYHLKTL